MSSFFFFFSSRRRHTRLQGDWSSDVCSSDLVQGGGHRAYQVLGQRACADGRPRELRDSRCGEDGDFRPNDGTAHQLYAFEDSDEPLRHGGGDRLARVLARLRGLLVLHRSRVRHFRGKSDLLTWQRKKGNCARRNGSGDKTSTVSSTAAG